MAWFVIQTLVEIVLAFVLGLLVGWLWWRRRKVNFGESDAVTTVTSQHSAALAAKQEELDRSESAIAEKDLEIGRLSGLVNDDALELAARHEASQAAKDAEIAELTTRLEARDAEVGRLAAVVDEAEAGAAALRDDLAARDATIADRDAALTAKGAELADRDAEIARLSAAAEAVEPAAEPTEPTAEPTEPTAEDVAVLATPVEETGAHAEPEPAPQPEPAAVTRPEPEPEPEPEPVTSVDLTSVEPDELERVEGIGPRIGAALRGAGITSFRQLAEADTATLQAALEQAGLRFAPSLPTWSRQAALLAAGDEAGFVKLTESLVAGRDVSGTKR